MGFAMVVAIKNKDHCKPDQAREQRQHLAAMTAEEVAQEIEEHEKHAGLSSSVALHSTSLHTIPLLSIFLHFVQQSGANFGRCF